MAKERVIKTESSKKRHFRIKRRFNLDNTYQFFVEAKVRGLLGFFKKWDFVDGVPIMFDKIDDALHKLNNSVYSDDVRKPYFTAKYDKQTQIMTVYNVDGTNEQYNGSGTVWHRMPYMERCSTAKEYLLCDIWHYIKHYGNPYPTAHENKDKDNNKQKDT